MKKVTLKKALIALFAFMLLTGSFTACDRDDDPVVEEADKTELIALVNECNALLNSPTLSADFPADAIAAFTTVVNAAKTLINNKEATQAQVNAIVVQLTQAKETFLASEYGLIPKTALIMGMTFDESVSNNQFKTAGKGWTAHLTKGPAEIFGENTNLPTFQTGKIGKAIYFSNGSHLRINDFTANDLLGSQLSISVWVKPDSTRAGNYIISYNYWNSWKFQLQEQNKPFFTIHTNADGWVDADNQMDFSAPNGEWTHLVVTLNMNTKKLVFYVNGKETMEWDETTKTGLTGTGAHQYKTVLPLMVGACTTYAEADVEWGWAWSRTPNGWDGFVGCIDELKLYNIALDAGQVAKLYKDEK
ncbi:MAG: hypothetical protein PHR08_05055 [Bacteroidales bacterium]|nr:hypothetical protein [Bacteroidales bacterium]